MAPPSTGAVATEVSPHEVKFVIGDGATHIEVKARGQAVKTEVEASALADLVGVHTWSGELFGVGMGRTDRRLHDRRRRRRADHHRRLGVRLAQ